MKFKKLLIKLFTADDLFRRVAYGLGSLLFMGLGMGLVALGLGWGNDEEIRGAALRIGAGCGGVMLSGLGLFYSGFTLTKPSNRWYQAGRRYPLSDGSDPGGSLIILFFTFLPAILITVILRVLGVRGSET